MDEQNDREEEAADTETPASDTGDHPTEEDILTDGVEGTPDAYDDKGLEAIEPLGAGEEPRAVIAESPEPLPGEVPDPQVEDRGLGAVDPLLGEEAIGPGPPAPDTHLPIPPPAILRVDSRVRDEGSPSTGSPDVISERASKSGTARLDENERAGEMDTQTRKGRVLARIEDDQKLIQEKIHNVRNARRLLDLARQARQLTLQAEGEIAEADRILDELEYRIALTEKVAQWSYTIGIQIFIYELVWMAGIFAVLVFGFGESALGRDSSLQVVLASSVLWGGLGGVFAACWALLRHVAIDQDFDRQYILWYLLSPLMGFALGGFAFLVLWLVLLSLTGTGELSSPLLIYLLAWLGGFWHDDVTSLVSRVLRSLRRSSLP